MIECLVKSGSDGVIKRPVKFVLYPGFAAAGKRRDKINCNGTRFGVYARYFSKNPANLAAGRLLDLTELDLQIMVACSGYRPEAAGFDLTPRRSSPSTRDP